MSLTTSSKRPWIGKWFCWVAALHTMFACLVFGKIFIQVVQRGVFNSVGNDPLIAAAIWFLLFGAVLALLGMAIHTLEQAGNFPSARSIGLGTLMLTILGVVLMPVSGFWLAFPPAIGLLRRKS
ncbi:DUF6463 family protein [Undibacterium sp. Jales W-56]|uniref:DUF6463 family protein n=1 Tax=Undibacterium sp. Jales W-56 TaxID=2897325 RepID=UPI0021D2EC94|nr:DUF6463 family protein [Undibacterium sp. Jales W-56]MCU6434266.1 DUF6463 family protein [Undibacterium sp. Jales W-56]